LSEIEVDGVLYRIGKLNGLRQFDVVRRLGPMVPILAQQVREGADKIEGARWIMGVAVGAAAEVKQADSDFVVQTCLGAVQRKDPATGAWVPLLMGGQVSEDVDLSVILEVLDAVLQENLGRFFGRLRAVSDVVMDPDSEPLAGSA
jgi:hypothetical protein